MDEIRETLLTIKGWAAEALEPHVNLPLWHKRMRSALACIRKVARDQLAELEALANLDTDNSDLDIVPDWDDE